MTEIVWIVVGHRFATANKYVLTVEAKERANIPVLLVCGDSADRVAQPEQHGDYWIGWRLSWQPTEHPVCSEAGHADTALVIGPAIAIQKSVLASGTSASICETPPSVRRVMA